MVKKYALQILIAIATVVCGTGFLFGGEPRSEGNMIKLVAFGDSTTAPRGSLQVYVDCLKRDLPKMGIEIDAINAGVGGNSTEDGRVRFAKDVLDRQPDIVVIQFGINDAAVDVWKTTPATEPRVTSNRYTSNLEYFVDKLQGRKCKVILMTPNPMRWNPTMKKAYGKPPYRPSDPDGFNVILKNYADCMRGVAKRKEVALVDVYAIFQAYGQNNNKGQTIDDLLLDGMHPNDKGHRLEADLLIKEISRNKVTATAHQGQGDALPASTTP